jgi:hypothetical protein
MYQEYSRQANKLNSVLRPYSSASFAKSLNGIDIKLNNLTGVLEKGFFNSSDIISHLNDGFFHETQSAYQGTLDMFSFLSLMRKYPRLYDTFNSSVMSVFANIDM